MRYAKLLKLGGEIIEAAQADYSDYKGFLRCPECGEPVFLRATHYRQGRFVEAAFVHYRAIPEVSMCELRIGNYSPQEVARRNAIARGQRLQKLRISFWKILKTNLGMDFKQWATYVREAKEIPFFGQVVEYGKLILVENPKFILDDTFPRIAEMMRTRDKRIAIDNGMESVVEGFMDKTARDWPLHCQIAKEALDFFLHSQELEMIQFRLAACLSHPSVLMRIDESMINLDTATKEWRGKFAAYLTLQICFVFLMIDWLDIFATQNKSEQKLARLAK